MEYSDKNSKYAYINDAPVVEEESNFNILEWVFRFLRYCHHIVLEFGVR